MKTTRTQQIIKRARHWRRATSRRIAGEPTVSFDDTVAKMGFVRPAAPTVSTDTARRLVFDLERGPRPQNR